MGTNARIFWVLTAFFAIVTVVYIGWSLLAADPSVPIADRIEWVGVLAIGLSGLLFAFLGFYFSRIHSSQGGELPEDRLDANIDDGDAEQGHFSPWSWWPIILGAAASITVLGLAIGAWIAVIGVTFLIIALVGWVYEYYRGYFVR